jgi:hypothetical protein
MYDDFDISEESHSDSELEYRPSDPRGNRDDKSLTHTLGDREVPVPTHGAVSVLHQWLDGDVSVAVLRATQGGNDSVDLWTKIHDEAETLRSRTTPLYVHKRIMDSLPDDTYRGHHPWYKRSIALNPVMVAIGAVALVGIGIIVAQTVFK